MAAKKSNKQAETMLEAVEAGDFKRLQELIDTGADANESEEYTALSKAAELGRVDMVNALLQAGADANFGGIWVPLCAAVRGKNIEVAQALLKAGAKVNAQEEEGATALMYAAASGNLEMVNLLLKAGANPKIKDEDGESAILYGEKWPKVVGLLKSLSSRESVAYLAKKSEKSDARAEELVVAATAGNLKQIEHFLASGVSIDGRGKEESTALIAAAEMGHKKIVETLLKAGANLESADKYGRTALWHAASAGHLAVAESLITARANLNAKEKLEGKTPFLSCIGRKQKNREMMCLLARHGADLQAVDSYGRSALSLACRDLGNDEFADKEKRRDAQALREAFIEIGLLHPQANKLTATVADGELGQVRKLIESGVPVNAVDEQERTALYMAISRQHPELVNYLLKSGADIHRAVGRDEKEDVQWGGISRPCPKCGKIFAAATRERRCPQCENRFDTQKVFGPKPGTAPLFFSWSNGHLPLMTAAKVGNVEIVNSLINAGAEVDRGKQGITPLMVACFFGHIKAVEVLTKRGADVNREAKTLDRLKEKITPVKIAAKEKHVEVVKLLWDAGAQVKDKKPTLLVAAAQSGDIKKLKELLAQGANAADQDALTGEWPLDIAASSGHGEAVAALIAAGAPVNPPTARQLSPLFHAMSRVEYKKRQETLSADEVKRYVEVTKKLLAAGAKANVNCFGVSPLSMAESSSCEPIIELLRTAVAAEKTAKAKR